MTPRFANRGRQFSTVSRLLRLRRDRRLGVWLLCIGILGRFDNAGEVRSGSIAKEREEMDGGDGAYQHQRNAGFIRQHAVLEHALPDKSGVPIGAASGRSDIVERRPFRKREKES